MEDDSSLPSQKIRGTSPSFRSFHYAILYILNKLEYQLSVYT